MLRLARTQHGPARILRRASTAALVAAVASGLALPGAAQARGHSRSDRDRDGLSSRYELRISRTNSRRRDTDRDRLSDGAEVRRYHTNPRRRDTDRDGLLDGLEVRRYHTNPRRGDTDRDGVSDGREVRARRGPRKPLPWSPPSTRTPDTVIDSSPTATTTSTSAIFRFHSDNAGAIFECRLDGAGYGLCAS